MLFILRMVRRELRSSWRRLIFFFVCVAIGVAAIVAIRSVIQNVRVALTGQARMLSGADVRIRSRQPWPDDVRRRIDDLVAALPVRQQTEVVETATMVRPAEPGSVVSRMVELLGVDPEYPMYGAIELQGGAPYSHDLLADHGILVKPELLTQLGVQVGDAILIGAEPFEVRGVVSWEPARDLGFFSLGSRVFIDRQALLDTGLLTIGSRASYRLLLRLDEADVDRVEDTLDDALDDTYLSVSSFRDREDRIGDNLERAENYLSLVGFVVIVLGGIGVWSVTRVFVRQKLRSIAVLKCIGGSSGQLLAVYVVQTLVLGIGGSLLGVVLASAILRLIPTDLLADLGNVRLALTASAAWQGVGVGTLVSLLFALTPLLEVRRVKPLLLLRDESDLAHASPGQEAGSRLPVWLSDPAEATAIAGVALALVAIAIWQAGSLEVGAMVCGGFLVVAMVLAWVGSLLVRAAQPLTQARWFPLRHAVISFGRPGSQTRVVLTAVGLGSFFIIGVHLLQANLLRELSFELREDAPNLFLLDIQQDQADGVRGILADQLGREVPPLIPVLRARVVGVSGQSISLDGYEDVRGRGSLSREYVVTYRGTLEENERIVDGTMWPDTPSADPEVSIEDSLRERYGIDVGDRVRFDVLGRVIEARVTSVREVEWSDSRRGGFMFLFRPGVFETAPHSYIATVRAPIDPAIRATLQRDLVMAYPNVSVIDVLEVLASIRGIVGNVTLAITIVGAVALLSGVLILIGSVAMTKFQRLYESALYKTLGATTRTIGMMLLLEYGTLGLLGGIVGSAGAVVLSWALSRWVLDIDWTLAPGVNLIGIILTATIVAAVGFAASFDVLRRKPLSILRAE